MKQTTEEKHANRYTSIVAAIYALTGCVLTPCQNADADALIKDAASENSDVKTNALAIVELLELPIKPVTFEV